MASNTMKTPSAIDPTIALFTQLNARVSLYNPPPRSTLRPSIDSDPNTILFLAWTDASPKHFSKYIQKYMALFPDARIILTTITMPEFLSPNESRRRAAMRPALEALLDQPSSETTQDRILVHGFSNGSLKRLWSLVVLYRQRNGKPLPAQLIVFDSCPGIAGRFWRDFYVLTRQLPKNLVLRLLFKTIAYLFSLGLWVLFRLTPFWQSFYKQPIRELNDNKFVSEKARRVYIYSKEDKVIHWKDVEIHAKTAENDGVVVERWCVPGTEHCAHAKGDNWNEYWELVTGAWERSSDIGGR